MRQAVGGFLETFWTAALFSLLGYKYSISAVLYIMFWTQMR